MKMRSKLAPLAISLAYAAFAGLWIFYSDLLVSSSADTFHDIRYWSTVKGWLYVLLTAVLLYCLMRSHFKSMLAAQRQLERENEACRLTQRALQDSEANYRAIFDSANDGILVYEIEPGAIIDVNRKACEMFGCTRKTLLEKGPEIIALDTPPFTRNDAREWIAKAAAWEPQLFEWKSRQQDGALLWLEVNLKRVTISGRDRLLAIVRDIELRKRAEEALRESEERYRSLVELSPEMIFIQCEGKLAFINRAGAELLGATEPEALLGKPVLEFIHPDFRETARERISRLREGRAVPRNEAKFLRLDGSAIDVEVSATPFTFRDTPAAMVLARDISAQLATQAEIRQTLSLLSATLEATADGILVRDTAGNIVTFNRKFAEMWHFSDAVLASKDDTVMRTSVLGQLKDPARFMAITEGLYLHPEAESHDLLEFKDGRVFERVSRPQMIENRIVGRVISFRDVTAQKALEARLRQAQKLEAIGTLAGGIAHDFNNMLTAINGYCTILQRKLRENEPLASYPAKILAVTEKAAALTKGLLAYSRKQPHNPQPVEVNEIVTKADALLTRLLADGIQLKTVLADERLIVLADGGQLEQVLLNLATNASDAMAGRGTLVIRTGLAEMAEEFATFHDSGKPGRYALIAVSDTGEGIDESTRERIFEPFYTTKEVGRGTGLGLAMVYGVVKQHHGYIDVASEPGTGTTFKIYLPLAGAATGEAFPEMPPHQGGAKRSS